MRSNLMRMAVVVVAAMTLVFVGCGDDGGGGTDGTDGTDGGGGFEAGMFQLYTKKVVDGCTDGALEVIFQPKAPAEYKLAKTTEFPAVADLPKNMTINLQEPFSSMNVEVTAGGNGGMTIKNAEQKGVAVGEGKNCTADMSIAADITIVAGNNDLDITATLEVSNWQGDDCPELEDEKADACTVTLTMRGERL